MILTEYGLTFIRDCDTRRCVQHPELRKYADGSYGLDGRPDRYPSLRDALAALADKSRPYEPPHASPPRSRRRTRLT